jgi:hypothetical protein
MKHFRYKMLPPAAILLSHSVIKEEVFYKIFRNLALNHQTSRFGNKYLNTQDFINQYLCNKIYK